MPPYACSAPAVTTDPGFEVELGVKLVTAVPVPMTVPSRLLVRGVISGVSVGTGTDTVVIVVNGTLSVVSDSEVDGSGASKLESVDSGGGGGGAIVGAVVGIEDGDVDGDRDGDVDDVAGVVSVADAVVDGGELVDGCGWVLEGAGEGVGVGVGVGTGVGVGVGVELGSPPHPSSDGTASGPFPISTGLVPQLAA